MNAESNWNKYAVDDGRSRPRKIWEDVIGCWEPIYRIRIAIRMLWKGW